MFRHGIDISHHNNINNWSKIKPDFIFYKCTQGITYLDPTYAAFKYNWKGISGAYHFADGGNAKNEADWFCKNAAKDDILILDWEIESINPVAWCQEFIDRVKEKTGKDCWLYTNDVRAVKYAWPKDWKFWIARYGVNDGTQSREPDFKNWSIWQYTSRGKADGVDGNVDLNVSKDDLIFNLNTMTEEHEKNYKKIAEAVAKKVDYDYGDNPSDGETKDILERLDNAFNSIENMEVELVDEMNKNTALNQKIQNQTEMLYAREQQIIELKEKCYGVESMTITQLIKEILNKILKS